MLTEVEYRELARLTAYEQAKASTSAFYVTGEDHLRVRSFGSLAGVTLAIEGRFLGIDGTIRPFAERHVPNSDRTVNTTLHGLGDGFLLNVQARASGGAPLAGQVIVIVELVRGLSGGTQSLATLLQGEVTSPQRLAWPGSPIRHSLDGPGILRAIIGTDPAAGVEISETVPTGARWALVTFIYQFVTDATATNRDSTVLIDDGTTVLWRSSPQAAQTASLSRNYQRAQGLIAPFVDIQPVHHSPIPAGLRLLAGARIRTNTAGAAAGDDYGAPVYTVLEHLEGA